MGARSDLKRRPAWRRWLPLHEALARARLDFDGTLGRMPSLVTRTAPPVSTPACLRQRGDRPAFTARGAWAILILLVLPRWSSAALPAISLRDAFPALALDRPVWMSEAADGSGHSSSSNNAAGSSLSPRARTAAPRGSSWTSRPGGRSTMISRMRKASWASPFTPSSAPTACSTFSTASKTRSVA